MLNTFFHTFLYEDFYMNKLTKLGAVALFSLVLAACNKADPAEDYQKLTQWNAEQSKIELEAQQVFQRDFNEALQSNDSSKAQAALETFAKALKASADSLDKLDVGSDEIKALKVKNKEVLTLSSDVFFIQSKNIAEHSEETQKALADKIEALNKANSELQAETQAIDQKLKK